MPDQHDAAIAVKASERAEILLGCLSRGNMAKRLEEVLGLKASPTNIEAVSDFVVSTSQGGDTDEVVGLVKQALDLEREPACHNGDNFCQLVAERKGTPETYALLLAIGLLSCGYADSVMIGSGQDDNDKPVCWVEAPSPKRAKNVNTHVWDIWIEEWMEDTDQDVDNATLQDGYKTMDIALCFVA